MSENIEAQTIDLIELSGNIVCAYVSNNSIPVAELPDLIRGIHTALTGLASGVVPMAVEAAPEKPTSTQIRKSVTPDGIVSFLDGKSYKTLKRHPTGHGLDPQSYRQRYGLPADYPMIAPTYAAQRSALAKSIGLGRVASRSEDEQAQGKGRKKTA